KAQLREAQEHQAATAEVLRVIASSASELQPVLDAIVESGMRLTGSANAALMIREGDQLVCVATVAPRSHTGIPLGAARSLESRHTSVRTLVERRTIHIPDRSDPVVIAAFPDNTG